MTPLDPTDLLDLYWAGRATLVGRHSDDGVYDQVFRRYFLGQDAPAAGQLTLDAESVAEAEATLVMPGTEPEEAREDEERPVLGWMASGVDALKHRSFTACTPDELAALRRIMTRMRLTPPRRRTRRTRPATGGGSARPARDHQGNDAHARGTARSAVLPAAQDQAAAADPDPRRLRVDGRLLAASAPVRAHGPARSGEGRGVLLRHQAHSRHHRRSSTGGPTRPSAQAARTVVDWDGGTRIGQSLDTFIRRWGRGGSLCRGGVVVICSDGLDRGDPESARRRDGQAVEVVLPDRVA